MRSQLEGDNVVMLLLQPIKQDAGGVIVWSAMNF